MLHVEFPPEFVHVSFTQAISQRGVGEDFVSDISAEEQFVANDGRFAVMGDYGNCINIYDSQTFILSHQIQV